ncbi:13867_t:CDS:2, partial [Cetraspora pellucida]
IAELTKKGIDKTKLMDKKFKKDQEVLLENILKDSKKAYKKEAQKEIQE